MSRAFIKEDAGDSDDLPERPQSASPNYVTPAGLEALRRKALELKAAVAGLPADDRRRKKLARDLKYYEGRLGSAILVNAAGRPGSEVRFGASVRARSKDGRERRFSIVGQDEADEAAGKLAWDSAPALACMGAKVGDRVEWAASDGPVVLRILEIRY